MNIGSDFKEVKKIMFDEFLKILKYEFNKAKLKYNKIKGVKNDN